MSQGDQRSERLDRDRGGVIGRGGTPAAQCREIELKFQLPPPSSVLLEASALLVGVAVTRLDQHTTYFDTRDEMLRAAGYTLRVRTCAGSHIQTVKSQASQGDLAIDRAEWEWKIAGETADVERLREVPGLVEMAARLEGKLTPVFITEIRRTRRTFRLRGNTIAELVIDLGSIRAGNAMRPVNELEVELKQGLASSMFALAAELQATAPMRLSAESKAARGWALRTGIEQSPQLAVQRPPLPNMDVAAAFRLQIGTRLAHLVANVEPTLRRDPEGLHQMRIALRGLRAVLRLFAPALHHLDFSYFDTALRKVCHRLGIARDWDVFCLQTLPLALQDLAPNTFSKLEMQADLRRAAAHTEVEAELQGQSFTGLLLELSVVTGNCTARRTVTGGRPVDLSVKAKLPRLLDLHRFRKSLDLLCDSANASVLLFTDKIGGRYIESCTALQEVLGEANDMVVSKRLAEGLGHDRDPGLMRDTKLVSGWSKRRKKTAVLGLKRLNATFRSSLPFWA